MEINLDDLLIIHSALVNVKMVLSKERKIKSKDLKSLVDEAYQYILDPSFLRMYPW
jgi:hypothetical protein